jgi:DNA-nicking Smr family endonuclease
VKSNTTTPPSARLRRLSDDEIRLWLAATREVARRAQIVVPTAPSLPPAPAEAPPEPWTVAAPRPPTIPALAPLDRRLRQKLSRGRMAADAVIDLHGLRQHEAFAALHRFLAGAQRDGARLVLVVTGKGDRPADGDAGVLRRLVPQWLGAAQLRGIVVGFEEAARSHGGAGALYVRLRRRDRPRDAPGG